MRVKLLTASMLALGLMGPTSFEALADDAPSDTISVNIGGTTDYRFRGISQRQTEPAGFGGIDYVSTSGFFMGAWASNVDFNDAAGTDVELDLYAGYTMSLADATTGTIKGVYYWYPDADYPPGGNENDYFELLISVGHDFGKFQTSFEVAWSPDFFFESGQAVAFTGGINVPLADSFIFFDGGVWASGKVGYQIIDDNATFGTPDYLFYDVGISGKVGWITLDVRYVSTDLDEPECFAGTKLCQDGLVGTATLAYTF
jgi:uncharacterized protein (TIGR02001 family)